MVNERIKKHSRLIMLILLGGCLFIPARILADEAEYLSSSTIGISNPILTIGMSDDTSNLLVATDDEYVEPPEIPAEPTEPTEPIDVLMQILPFIFIGIAVLMVIGATQLGWHPIVCVIVACICIAMAATGIEPIVNAVHTATNMTGG